MAKITIKAFSKAPPGVKILLVTITLAVASLTSYWIYTEAKPVDVSGIWVFDGILHVETKDGDPISFDSDVYDGWIVPIEQNGNSFDGKHDSNRVVYGSVGGKDINFILEISDSYSPDGCGDYSIFEGTLENSGFLSSYDTIKGTLKGSDCDNWSQWTGDFTINVVGDEYLDEIQN